MYYIGYHRNGAYFFDPVQGNVHYASNRHYKIVDDLATRRKEPPAALRRFRDRPEQALGHPRGKLQAVGRVEGEPCGPLNGIAGLWGRDPGDARVMTTQYFHRPGRSG